jgi:hypothetical protein
VEPHHQLLFIRRPAEHTEKEDAAVDFFRLHPVKMKGPTDNIEVEQRNYTLLYQMNK